MPAPNAPPAPAVVLPLHAAVGVGVVRRGPGRPRRARPAPDVDAIEYRDTFLETLSSHVEASPVVRTAEDFRDGSSKLAWCLLEAMAAECASLGFEIERMVPGSREQERARSRRIDGLVSIAKLRIEIAKLEHGDVTPAHMAKLVELFIREVESAAAEVLSPDLAAKVTERTRTEIALVVTELVRGSP